MATKKKKKTHILSILINYLVVAATSFFIGAYVSKPAPSTGFDYSNVYAKGMHYIVFYGDGKITIVNYTLDSLKKATVFPVIPFFQK
jgi:hypothetical protein